MKCIVRIWLKFKVTIDFDRFFPKRIKFDSQSRQLIIVNLSNSIYFYNLFQQGNPHSATPKTPEYPFSFESINFLHFVPLYLISKFLVKIRNQRPRKPRSYNFHPNHCTFLKSSEYWISKLQVKIHNQRLSKPLNNHFYSNQVNFYILVRHFRLTILNFRISSDDS